MFRLSASHGHVARAAAVFMEFAETSRVPGNAGASVRKRNVHNDGDRLAYQPDRLAVQQAVCARARTQDTETRAGMAPAFRLFVPRARLCCDALGLRLKKLAESSWESDPRRPVLRTCTECEFNRASGRIACNVIDLGLSCRRLHRVEVGYRIGLVGFENELQIGSAIPGSLPSEICPPGRAIEPIKANVLPVSTCLPVAAVPIVERHRRRLPCRSR